MLRFTSAPRLRWLWLAWKHLERTWVGSGMPCDDKDKAISTSTTDVTVHNDTRTSLCHCNWLRDRPLRLAFPDMFNHAIKKNRTAVVALHEDRWVLDLRHDNIAIIPPQFIQLLWLVRRVCIILVEGMEDEITWTAGGLLSTLPDRHTSISSLTDYTQHSNHTYGGSGRTTKKDTSVTFWHERKTFSVMRMTLLWL